MDKDVFQTYFQNHVGLVCRVIRWSHLKRNPLAQLLRILSRNIYHVALPSGQQSLATLRMPHPHAITISSRSTIGNHVIIYQCVTLAGKRAPSGKTTRGRGAPKIGNNVIIFPNSVVVGGVHVDDNVIIAAGSVVIHDVPKGAIVAGNPAKVVGYVEGHQ